MSKRIKSKHKVDRRLGVNLWGRPKSPYNKGRMVQDNMVKELQQNHRIIKYNYKLSKN